MSAPNDEGSTAAAATPPEQKQADAQSVAKKIATLRALMALHDGHELIELDDFSYVVCKRGLSRRCATIAEVEQFAKRIGVPGL